MNPEFEIRKKLDAEKDADGQRFVGALMELSRGDSLKYLLQQNYTQDKKKSALRLEYKDVIKNYYIDENKVAHTDKDDSSPGKLERIKEFENRQELIEKEYAQMALAHFKRTLDPHGGKFYEVFMKYAAVVKHDKREEEDLKHQFLTEHFSVLHAKTAKKIIDSLEDEILKQEKEIIAGEKYEKPALHMQS